MPTNQSTRVPLIGNPDQRAGDSVKDQRFINTVTDIVDEVVYLHKRPGLQLKYNKNGVSRGIIYWENNLYYVVGDKLYKNDTSIFTLPTTTGLVGFTGGRDTEDYLFLCDGTNGWRISKTDVIQPVGWLAVPTRTTSTAYAKDTIIKVDGVTSVWYQAYNAGTTSSSLNPFAPGSWPTTVGSVITEPGTSMTWKVITVGSQMPANHLPAPVFMDGYIFVATENEIYNCELEAPLYWKSSSYIGAEMYPDKIVALSRQANQVVAIGQQSTEFFYDAGNAVGSPLARTDQAVYQGGTVALGSVAQAEGILVYAARSATGNRYVVAIDGLSPTPISTPVINSILDGAVGSTSNWAAALVRLHGVLCYVLFVGNRTVVYNFNTKMWSEFTGSDGNAFAFLDMVPNTIHPIVMGMTGKVFDMMPNVYQDDGQNFTVTIQTTRIDSGSSNRKYMNRVELIGDYYGTSNPVAFSFSDDDYQTWTAARTMDLANRAFLYRLGSFRRRSFKITHSENKPLRLTALDLFLDGGTH